MAGQKLGVKGGNMFLNPGTLTEASRSRFAGMCIDRLKPQPKAAHALPIPKGNPFVPLSATCQWPLVLAHYRTIKLTLGKGVSTYALFALITTSSVVT